MNKAKLIRLLKGEQNYRINSQYDKIWIGRTNLYDSYLIMEAGFSRDDQFFLRIFDNHNKRSGTLIYGKPSWG